jgi:hypothetical protein
VRYRSGRYTGIVRHLAVPGTGRAMRSAEILAEFGLPPTGPIPANYEDTRYIQGVVVRIRPKARRGMEKRVFARCPDCDRWVEAGHLHQHTEARHT